MKKKKAKWKAELQRIADKYGERFSPEVVWREAKNPKSPLHECFEWDPSKAMREYNLMLARKLIATLEIRILANGSPERAFISLEVFRGERESYIDKRVALKDVDLRAHMVKQGLDAVDSLLRNYQSLSEFAPIFAAILQVRKATGNEVKVESPMGAAAQ